MVAAHCAATIYVIKVWMGRYLTVNLWIDRISVARFG